MKHARYTHIAIVWLGLCAMAAHAFEQDQRINKLTLVFNTDTFAPSNAIGLAITSAEQANFQTAINNHIADGSTSILLAMPGLTNFAGSNQPVMQIGVLNGTPVGTQGNPVTYTGSTDLDWWYGLNPTEMDAAGTSLTQLSGSIASSVLNAGPVTTAVSGLISFSPSPLALAGGRMDLSTAVLKANIGGSSAPLQSTNGLPPGHRAGENISPSLTTFINLTNGQLKGNVSAASLAATPCPTFLQGGTPAYTSANSLLDVFVSGLKSTGGFTAVIFTQPDQANPAALVGGGPPYRFATDSFHSVNSCRDKNNNPVPLADGLNAAAYSVYFTFTCDRVIDLTPARISLEQPAGNVLTNGSTISFGYVNAGTNLNQTFTIRNVGLADLTNINLAVTGTDAAMFNTISNPAATVSGGGGTTSFTIQFAPPTNGLRNATARITSSDSTNSPFNLSLTGRGLSDLEAWRLKYFNSPDNSGTGADANDYSGDGLANIVEYAFGFDPTINNAGKLPRGQIIASNFVLSFTQPAGVSGISYNVQQSDVVPSVTWNNVADSGSSPQHTFAFPISAHTQTFLRLTVTAP